MRVDSIRQMMDVSVCGSMCVCVCVCVKEKRLFERVCVQQFSSKPTFSENHAIDPCFSL